MYALKLKEGQKNTQREKVLSASKRCAYIAVFVALVIAAQLCLAAIPGVEVVTLLFVSFAFAFGVKEGVVAATAFSLLRLLIFGFYPNVLLLYLIYYNSLAALFGFLGGRVKNPIRALWWIVLVACLCTALFSMLDNLITILWYQYAPKAARAYFFASLSVLLPQVICTAVTVAFLFLPLQKVFALA
jgi:hypothetical protein